MSNFINPKQQKALYTDQLKHWIESTGQHQKTLSRYTKELDHPLKATSYSRTINNIPANKTGRKNLYIILATIQAFHSISEHDIQQFLDTHHIEYTKEGLWQDIWQQILDYSQQIQRIYQQNPQTRKAVSYPKTFKSQVISFGLIFLLGTVTFLSLTQQAAPIPLLPCKPISLPPATPDFNRQQGYSHYTQPTDPQQSGLLINNIRTIAHDIHGVWIGYAPTTNSVSGITYYDGSQWYLCSGLELASGQFINSIAFLDNQVFLAVDNLGIARLNTSGWRIFDRADLPSNGTYDLYLDPSGRLFVTTLQGVLEYNPNQDRWDKRFQVSQGGLISNHVHTMVQDLQYDLWFGHHDRGISRFRKDGTWDHYYTNTPGTQNVRQATVDLDGGVWFATDGGGVLYFDQDQWHSFNLEAGFYSNNAQDVEVDQYGRIWVATDHGSFYTSDKGESWHIHSTQSTWDIALGCEGCAYDQRHLWVVVRGEGLAHVRLPPPSQTIRIIETPVPPQLHPGEEYIFEVEAQVIGEQLTELDGDSLKSADPDEQLLYGAYEIIPFRGDDMTVGSTYIFSNIDDPMIAPDEPGTYTFNWRVWQGRRYVTDNIQISFDVVPPS